MGIRRYRDKIRRVGGPTNISGPIRRPFDAMRKIGFQFDLSDYDVQVSSNEIETRVMSRAGSDPPAGVTDLIWPKGKFFQQEYS